MTLRLHHFLGPDSIAHRLLIEPWATRIEQASGGRIAVEIHPEMRLGGKATELVDQVRDGTVDIVWTAAAYTPGAFPRAEVFTLPLVHEKGAIATNRAIAELMETDLRADFAGLHPLFVHVHPGHALLLGAKRVERFDDVAGLTLRPPGRGIGLWTVEALGAEPTKKRHPRLGKALENGDIDGVLMSLELAKSLEVTEAAKSIVFFGDNRYFGTSLYLFLMNAERYAALPADLRAVVDENSGAALATEMGRAWEEAGIEALAAARENGAETVMLTGAEEENVRAALGAVVDRWIATVEKAGLDGAALVAAARAAIARNAETAD
ncbi:MAG: TRAP transporter substrate-binding protein [Hyphomicrobiales bacterium]|nr:TRAP transporter substrate-binding protein [Hyphomicrobiales bacterium]